MDELARITVDEQTETQRREARKFVEALSGDVNVYFERLSPTMTAPTREAITRDFACRWHEYQLSEAEFDLSILYAGEDGE